MPITLSPRQIEAIRCLDWLFDESPDTRMTGRTWAIAVALIRKALRHPGELVHFTDHAPVHNPQTAEYVTLLIREEPSLRTLSWHIHRENFSLDGMDPQQAADWWPSTTVLPGIPTPDQAQEGIERPTVWEHLGREDGYPFYRLAQVTCLRSFAPVTWLSSTRETPMPS